MATANRDSTDIAVDRGPGGKRSARRDQDGVAAGIGARDHLGADAAARAAAAVFHDDCLTEHFAEAIGDDAGHAVGRPTGRERHDHSDRPVGKGLALPLRVATPGAEQGRNQRSYHFDHSRAFSGSTL
jgi:hypothetical protein